MRCIMSMFPSLSILTKYPGTNDVGALKQAHVGVSILNSPELEKRANARLDVSAKAAAYQPGHHSNSSSGSSSCSSSGSASGKATSTLERLAAEQAAVAELERLDPSLVQLGDASIASPFTSRRSSVDCVLAVVRQGRCTLVTTTQVFKILALNCLVSAFMLSTLYLHGVKQVCTIIQSLLFYLPRYLSCFVLSCSSPSSGYLCSPNVSPFCLFIPAPLFNNLHVFISILCFSHFLSLSLTTGRLANDLRGARGSSALFLQLSSRASRRFGPGAPPCGPLLPCRRRQRGWPSQRARHLPLGRTPTRPPVARRGGSVGGTSLEAF